MTPEFSAFSERCNQLSRFVSTTHSTRILIASISEETEEGRLPENLIQIKENAPNFVDWRVLEHTLAVTHLYALFEQFFEETIASWVDFLTGIYSFSDLPDKMQSAYQSGFSSVISKLPSPRYPALTVSRLVNNFDQALKGDEDYRLQPECITYRNNNLRWKEVCEIFSRCNITSLNDWINKNDGLLSHLGNSTDKVAEQVESRLANFVQYRNDCSHGIVASDEILGHEELQELIRFIVVMASSLSQVASWKRIEELERQGSALELGKVTEVFEKAEAIIVSVSEVTVRKGQKIYWKKAGNFGATEVVSLQLFGKDYDEVVATDAIELGLKLTHLPQRGTTLYADATER